mmetsp:Transcript_15079/g.32947  ORF Transcript_15079/g.32947 Transcript_15079/m.32947 type:complete len:491 (-) Transcript_15079:58-1530(-)|eukprot:CAMPEP_0168717706 /NCGR_PEP_ID=MMETSP0724-20121128/137_1 /TAXON_ID=265536 /ORGANISM="Amphiprora sp., Strain CCMP467" /LENGTH=490 /DNA_ID=CAMNT_0008764189 /DNA_START=73 /DNA_END=1545 /DNA_ORIENTATION=-
MKLHLAIVLLLLEIDSSSAFLSPTPRSQYQRSQRQPLSASNFDHNAVAEYLNSESRNLDNILDEKSSTSSMQETKSSRRHKVVLPNHIDEHRTTILASAVASTTSTESTQLASAASAATADATTTTTDDADADPYASAFDSQMEKIQQYAERVEDANKGSSLGDRFKEMDLQDIISTLIIPSIAVFAAGRWVYNRVSNRVVENTDSILESFSREMIYHDGDFDEMKLCYSDYSRKLLFLGPTRTETMLKIYLEAYAKKKTVSPQAIVSLSYVFTLAKLSEERAAGILVALCRQMGSEKISSAGKLLFLGTRILKSAEGRSALEPIKDMIKATYRDATVADTLVETSQQAIAEASYRAAVLAGGKSQKALTVGWETLGLDRDTAERIFAEEAEEGFLSDREVMYGGQTTKYDKKGRRLDKEGKIEDPEEAKAAEEEQEEEAVSGAYECGECGFTLFVAEGRESKFYGSDFKCPECGAGKDKFTVRDDFGED